MLFLLFHFNISIVFFIISLLVVALGTNYACLTLHSVARIKLLLYFPHLLNVVAVLCIVHIATPPKIPHFLFSAVKHLFKNSAAE